MRTNLNMPGYPRGRASGPLLLVILSDEPLIKLRFSANTCGRAVVLAKPVGDGRQWPIFRAGTLTQRLANRNLTDLFVEQVLELLSGPTPDAFVGCHIAVCDFEDRIAQFWANYDISKAILLRKANH